MKRRVSLRLLLPFPFPPQPRPHPHLPPFARLLKNNGKGEIRFDQLAAEVDRIRMERPQDKKIQELKDLIIRCQSLY